MSKIKHYILSFTTLFCDKKGYVLRFNRHDKSPHIDLFPYQFNPWNKYEALIMNDLKSGTKVKHVVSSVSKVDADFSMIFEGDSSELSKGSIAYIAKINELLNNGKTTLYGEEIKTSISDFYKKLGEIVDKVGGSIITPASLPITIGKVKVVSNSESVFTLNDGNPVSDVDLSSLDDSVINILSIDGEESVLELVELVQQQGHNQVIGIAEKVLKDAVLQSTDRLIAIQYGERAADILKANYVKTIMSALLDVFKHGRVVEIADCDNGFTESNHVDLLGSVERLADAVIPIEVYQADLDVFTNTTNFKVVGVSEIENGGQLIDIGSINTRPHSIKIAKEIKGETDGVSPASTTIYNNASTSEIENTRKISTSTVYGELSKYSNSFPYYEGDAIEYFKSNGVQVSLASMSEQSMSNSSNVVNKGVIESTTNSRSFSRIALDEYHTSYGFTVSKADVVDADTPIKVLLGYDTDVLESNISSSTIVGADSANVITASTKILQGYDSDVLEDSGGSTVRVGFITDYDSFYNSTEGIGLELNKSSIILHGRAASVFDGSSGQILQQGDFLATLEELTHTNEFYGDIVNISDSVYKNILHEAVDSAVEEARYVGHVYGDLYLTYTGSPVNSLNKIVDFVGAKDIKQSDIHGVLPGYKTFEEVDGINQLVNVNNNNSSVYEGYIEGLDSTASSDDNLEVILHFADNAEFNDNVTDVYLNLGVEVPYVDDISDVLLEDTDDSEVRTNTSDVFIELSGFMSDKIEDYLDVDEATTLIAEFVEGVQKVFMTSTVSGSVVDSDNDLDLVNLTNSVILEEQYDVSVESYSESYKDDGTVDVDILDSRLSDIYDSFNSTEVLFTTTANIIEFDKEVKVDVSTTSEALYSVDDIDVLSNGLADSRDEDFNVYVMFAESLYTTVGHEDVHLNLTSVGVFDDFDIDVDIVTTELYTINDLKDVRVIDLVEEGVNNIDFDVVLESTKGFEFSSLRDVVLEFSELSDYSKEEKEVVLESISYSVAAEEKDEVYLNDYSFAIESKMNDVVLQDSETATHGYGINDVELSSVDTSLIGTEYTVRVEYSEEAVTYSTSEVQIEGISLVDLDKEDEVVIGGFDLFDKSETASDIVLGEIDSFESHITFSDVVFSHFSETNVSNDYYLDVLDVDLSEKLLAGWLDIEDEETSDKLCKGSWLDIDDDGVLSDSIGGISIDIYDEDEGVSVGSTIIEIDEENSSELSSVRYLDINYEEGFSRYSTNSIDIEGEETTEKLTRVDLYVDAEEELGEVSKYFNIGFESEDLSSRVKEFVIRVEGEYSSERIKGFDINIEGENGSDKVNREYDIGMADNGDDGDDNGIGNPPVNPPWEEPQQKGKIWLIIGKQYPAWNGWNPKKTR